MTESGESKVGYISGKDTKTCTVCGEEKRLNEFSFRKDRQTHISICKKCKAVKGKDYRNKNLEKTREYVNAWLKKHPEKRRAYSKRAYENGGREKTKEWARNNVEKRRASAKKQRLKQAALRRSPTLSFSDSHKDELTKDYLEGMSLSKIKRKYQCGSASIKDKIKKWGLPVRAVPEKRPKHKNLATGFFKANPGSSFYDVWVFKYGKDEADRLNASRSGKTGASLRQKYKNGFVRINLGRKGRSTYQIWTEKYGKVRADELNREMKQKMSLNRRGSKNSMFGRPSPSQSSRGGTGWYNGIFFRSLKELTFMIHLDENGDAWESAEHISIPYVVYETERTYHPDFLVNKNRVIEIKPLRSMSHPRVLAKTKAAIEYCLQKGWTYEMKDVEPDINKIYSRYVNKTVIFTDKFLPKFLRWQERIQNGNR